MLDLSSSKRQRAFRRMQAEVMSFCGPEAGSSRGVGRFSADVGILLCFLILEETAAKKDLCAQYRTKLDVVGLGRGPGVRYK